MRRTIETALFGLPQLDGALPKVAAEDGGEGLIQSPDDPEMSPPPLIATDLLRERCAHFTPDSRLPRSGLEQQYAHLQGGVSIDFSRIDEEDTPFLQGRERNEPEVGSTVLAKRAEAAIHFLAFDLDVSYRSVAVVSHKHFLGALTGLHEKTVQQKPFENAEKRTVLLCYDGSSKAAEEEVQKQKEELERRGLRPKPVSKVKESKVAPEAGEKSEL